MMTSIVRLSCYIYIFLLKFFTLQNKAYHKTKTKDDTYNITDTSKKMTTEQINANNITLQT